MNWKLRRFFRGLFNWPLRIVITTNDLKKNNTITVTATIMVGDRLELEDDITMRGGLPICIMHRTRRELHLFFNAGRPGECSDV